MNKYKDKTAIGIVTCNRPEFCEKCIKSIDKSVGNIYVYNAGTIEVLEAYNNPNNENIPVGIAKNTLIRKIREMESNEYIFIIEDDVIIKDNTVFEKYIDTASRTGLWGCLSYGGHGNHNKNSEGVVTPVESVKYDDITIDLYRNSLAAFTLYHRNIFREIGFFDERFVNAAEHLDHYVEQYVQGIAPPFWYFPDIHESWKYIQDIDIDHSSSIIRNSPEFKQIISDGWNMFKKKRGMYPTEIPIVSTNNVMEVLQKIEVKYGKPISE